MMVDILNIGKYRLTSHGGRSFDLFDREADKVITISKDDYKYITGETERREARCFDVMGWNKK